MAFTTPCFIHKNTPELCKKLEGLGYMKNSPMYTDNCDILWAYQYSQEKGFDTPHYVIANAFDVPFDKSSRLCGEFIDCGINEELFLSIAAMRDDNDYMQWFTDGDDDFWFLCGDKKCDENIKYYQDRYNKQIHKATVSEIIEYFRKKGE